METFGVVSAVIEAEKRLARSLLRLAALRRAALLGSFDADVFDNAVTEYRLADAAVVSARHQLASQPASAAARYETREVRQAGRRASAAPAGHSNGVEAQPGSTGDRQPLAITPGLHFARWLVQTGRLSEWDTPEPDVPVPIARQCRQR